MPIPSPDQLNRPLHPAARQAVLDAARRKRSLRMLVVPSMLIAGLTTPVVALGVTDPAPGDTAIVETTTTDTNTTTTTTSVPATTDTTETTNTIPETTTRDDDPADDTPAEPDPGLPVDPLPGVAPAPAPEPATTPEPTGVQLLAQVEAEKRKPGRGKNLSLTARERRLIREAERKRDVKRAQSTLGPSSLLSSGSFGDLLRMPGITQAIPEKAINSFQIPPFLLPIYQAAGAQYGIRWEVLAAINEIETNYGRNLNISSAGAQGWMQFMPSTWEQYGTDANRDGRRDPYNPVDAIFAAGRYLKAAGANTDLRRAIFAYNHADWYVTDVLKRARRIAAIPPSLTDALAQMADGYFPIAGTGKVKSVDDGVNIKTVSGSPVIAVQDGEIIKSGVNKRLGRYIKIRDAQGTIYTYGNLGSVGRERDGTGWARRLPSTSKPAPDFAGPAESDIATGSQPDAALSAWTQRPASTADLLTGATSLVPDEATAVASTPAAPEKTGEESEPRSKKTAKRGRKIVAGTILARAGSGPVRFEIRPAGAGRIDPAPMLTGWKLLQTTALFRVKGRASGQAGQVLLMSKEALEHRVLHDPRIELYEGGRNDVAAGIIDRRVLATLAFLAESGLNPTVSSLLSGHSLYTASGNISEHSSGNAVDISAINGIPIAGNQGKDSITATTVMKLLSLQGSMKPHQIISLMKFDGSDNTFAMGDHDDHIHVGFHPTGLSMTTDGSSVIPSVLKPDQWDALVDRIGSIENPEVSDEPSKAALKVARQQLQDAAVARKAEKVLSYDSYQSGVKDPFIPPWLAHDQN